LASEIDQGFSNKSILELGPLEGGHSYMMSDMGAESVTSIESNSRAFIKCLIVKEILQMGNVNFLLGDFDKFLQTTNKKYDFVLASGVIYHCLNPIQVLSNISKVTDQIGIWSHYFDHEICNSIYKERFDYKGKLVLVNNFEARYFQLDYKESLNWSGFCGGPNPSTNWIEKSTWINFFNSLGFDFKIIAESLDHPNGPEFTAIATRKSGAK
jgi:hypothetical protein